MKKLSLLIPLSSFLLFGCDETTNVTETTGPTSVAKFKDLAECTDENEGDLVYVKDSAAAYLCADGVWNVLSASAADGSDGKDGSDGSDGKNGENGTSCTATALKDKSGFELTCGGKVVGTITNGTDGTNGLNGENGTSCESKKNKDGSWKAGENGQNGLYGRVEVDTTLPRLTVVTSEFRYAAPEQFVSVDNHAELIASRLSDGSLPYSTFARLRQESMLIDRGTSVEPTVYRGIPVNGISYLGIAPDLGAYEYGEEQETSVGSIAVEPLQGHISVQQTAGGLSLITIIGAPDIRQLQLSVCDAAGRMHTLHDFTGHTTAVRLPQGVALLRVTDSKGLVATAKVIVK